MSLASGTKFGRYQIRSKLGGSGMGEIYLARDQKLNRDVAIKVVNWTTDLKKFVWECGRH